MNTTPDDHVRLPGLGGLDERAHRRVEEVGRRVPVPAHWSLILEQSPADSAYLLLEGRVEVRARGNQVTQLGPGSFIGEIALIAHRLRSATLTTLEPVTTLAFSRADFTALRAEIPAFDRLVTDLAQGQPEENTSRPEIDTVVLDVDGTLVDTVYHHVRAWQTAFRAVGLDVPGWRLHRAIGMGGDRLVTHVAGAAAENSHGERVRGIHDAEFSSMLPDVQGLPGAARRSCSRSSATVASRSPSRARASPTRLPSSSRSSVPTTWLTAVPRARTRTARSRPPTWWRWRSRAWGESTPLSSGTRCGTSRPRMSRTVPASPCCPAGSVSRSGALPVRAGCTTTQPTCWPAWTRPRWCPDPSSRPPGGTTTAALGPDGSIRLARRSVGRLGLPSLNPGYAGTMTDSARSTVTDLLREHGTTYVTQAGITLRDKPSPLYQLLVLTTLSAARISAEIAVHATQELLAAGWRTPQRMRDTTWQERVDALGRGGYRRFDESAATTLGNSARWLLQTHRGDLRRVRLLSHDDVAALREALTDAPGVGPAGASIFCREVQAVWPEVRPFFDERGLRTAKRLGLPSAPEELASLVPADRLADLSAALVRAPDATS